MSVNFNSDAVVHVCVSHKCLNNCKYCYRHKGDNIVFFKEHKAHKTINKLYKFGIRNIALTGGNAVDEELLLSLVTKCSSLGIFTMLDVDGRNLTDKFFTDVENHLDVLGLPIDSVDEVNDNNRGYGHLKRVKEILELTKDKSYSVRINTVVTNNNIDKLQHIAELLHGYNIKLWTLHELSPLFTREYNIGKTYQEWHVEIGKIEYLSKLINEKYKEINIRLLPESKRINSYLFVDIAGRVYTHPENNGYTNVGNIYKKSITAICNDAGISCDKLITKKIPVYKSNGEALANELIGPTDCNATNTSQCVYNAIGGKDLILRDKVLRGIVVENSVMKRVKFIRCDLSHTTFRNVDLYRARFIECTLYDTRFIGCNLTRGDFRSSDLYGFRLEQCDLNNSIFDKKLVINIPRSVPSPDLRRNIHAMKAEVYTLLAKVKKDNLSYSEASFYRYMQKKEISRSKNMFLRCLDWLFADVAFKYCESPSRIVLTSSVVILTFSLIYYILSAQVAKAGSFGSALYFSICSFTGFGDIETVMEPWYFSFLVSLEALAGPILISLFLVAFVRRMLSE